jgi:hypothetical protein
VSGVGGQLVDNGERLLGDKPADDAWRCMVMLSPGKDEGGWDRDRRIGTAASVAGVERCV